MENPDESFQYAYSESKTKILEKSEEEINKLGSSETVQFAMFYVLQIARNAIRRSFDSKDKEFNTVLIFPDKILEVGRRLDRLNLDFETQTEQQTKDLMLLKQIKQSFADLQVDNFSSIVEIMHNSLDNLRKQIEIKPNLNYEEIYNKYSLLTNHLESFQKPRLD